MKRQFIYAVFDGEASLLEATDDLSAEGLPIVDAYTPYAMEELEGRVEAKGDRLSGACFAGGIVGLTVSLGFMIWTSAIDWPMNVGGKPYLSLPALIPVAFETTILFAALATLAAFLAGERLGPGRVATPELQSASDNRFVLLVEILPGRAQLALDILQSAGAVETGRPEGDGA